jgi:hypothetical protein
MEEIKRICLWSGPRNISTALMYSFAQRKDTKVFDEPLYGYYLSHHPEAHKYHPGALEIISSMENDGEKVIEMMISNREWPVLFFKHMTHHLLGLKKDFMKKTINIILTRDPREMLPSFDKVIPNPSLNDVGYALHIELINYFEKHNIPFAVLDAKRVLENPKERLSDLCKFAGITFDENMLSWKPQRRLEDGVWSKYWYKSVHASSGLKAYSRQDENFPQHLEPLLLKCIPYYKRLMTYVL